MSDWALGKKLNSQIEDVPLNHLIWLQDYKTFGEDSYVFQDKDILHELYRSRIAMNDISISCEAFNYAIEQGYNVGSVLANIYGVDKHVLQGIETLDELCASEPAMTAICASEPAMTAICASEPAMTTISNAIDNEVEFLINLVKECQLPAAAIYNIYKNNIVQSAISFLRLINKIGLQDKLLSSDKFTITTESTSNVEVNKNLSGNIAIMQSIKSNNSGDRPTIYAYSYGKGYEYYNYPSIPAKSTVYPTDWVIFDGLTTGNTTPGYISYVYYVLKPII